MTESGFPVGGRVDEVGVTLRIYADDLDPEWVAALLGVAPTFAARKGEPQSPKHQIVQRVGMWQLGLPISREWILGDAIETLLSRLPSEMAVWEQLSSRAKTDVSCGLFLARGNWDAELPPELLGELARRCLKLSLDIYQVAKNADD